MRAVATLRKYSTWKFKNVFHINVCDVIPTKGLNNSGSLFVASSFCEGSLFTRQNSTSPRRWQFTNDGRIPAMFVSTVSGVIYFLYGIEPEKNKRNWHPTETIFSTDLWALPDHTMPYEASLLCNDNNFKVSKKTAEKWHYVL